MAKKEDMYLTGSDSFKAYASQGENDIDRDLVLPRGGSAKAYNSRTFESWTPNISVRSDYNRTDYEYFRPSYTVPTKQKEIIGMCGEAYQKVGLVRNVVDLMGDFGAQGIRLQHTIPSTQEFYISWAEKIGMNVISERFLNTLYRLGQVILKASYGKVSVYEEKKWRKSKAQDIEVPKVVTKRREIPLKYTFIDPMSIDVIGQDLAQFVGQPILALKLTAKLRGAISTARAAGKQLAPEIQKMIEKIPADVLDAILNGKKYIPLDMDKTSIYHYKKDDWMIWANPMCYAILDDLLMLNKLKLADISALDGAISNIRLWTLGIIGDSPNNSILPTKAGINKLRSILANNVGGGVLDLVWGPELKMEESNSQVWRFLGSEKYVTTINSIYEGLGIPAPLRAGSGQSNTGNFVGLNTLIKRLQYGRDRLIEFWTKEIKAVHKAMGFPGKPPQVVFDFMALADEAAEKQLLINLWDRDIISDDTILELFGRLPNIEKSRVKREMNERTNEVMPYKASPFHNPDKEHEYRKILLQGGGVAPSEIGIDLQDRKPNELPMIDIQQQQQKELKQMDLQSRETMNKQNKEYQMKIKKMGTPGRPKNITETKKRKPKPTGKPSTKAEFVELFFWANAAQTDISNILTPALLASLEKSNMRSLSREEFDLVEKIKLDVLSNMIPFEEITTDKVNQIVASNLQIDPEIAGAIKSFKAQFVSIHNRQPKIEELRQIYSSAYALANEEG